MDPRFIPYKGSEIAYYQFGRGRMPVFCFHGYGDNGRSFEFLGRIAGETYTFFAVELPFHGKTRWRGGEIFQVADLRQVLDMIIQKEQGPHVSFESYFLMGFSLGGRMLLSLFEDQPAPVKKMILLAPDGLKVNFWYWLATQTFPGKQIFRFTMKNPGWFFGMLSFFHRLGGVNKSVVKFVHYYIDNPHLREELYERWMVLRKIRPDLSRIKQEVNTYHTPVRLIYGKHDRIILPVRGHKFREGIEPYCSLSVIASGHQVLHEKHAKEILNALQQ